MDTTFFENSFFIKLFYNSALTFDGIISGQKPEQYPAIFKDKNLYNPLKEMQKISQPALQDTNPADSKY
jgi:hypothetical protein